MDPSSFSKTLAIRLLLIVNVLLIGFWIWRDPILAYFAQNTSAFWFVETVPFYKSFFKTNQESQNDSLMTYQMMKDLHELFEKNKISYWADGGTLLGAIRHRGQIPWDKDLDLSIRFQDAIRLQKIEPQLAELGYTLTETFYGFTIALDHLKTSISFGGLCRIYTTVALNGRRSYASLQARSMWPKGFLEQDLRPLRLAPFGAIKIQIPHNPMAYLDSLYENWRTIAYRGRAQSGEELPPSAPFQLTQEDYEPAKPMGPLIDRVKK